MQNHVNNALKNGRTEHLKTSPEETDRIFAFYIHSLRYSKNNSGVGPKKPNLIAENYHNYADKFIRDIIMLILLDSTIGQGNFQDIGVQILVAGKKAELYTGLLDLNALSLRDLASYKTGWDKIEEGKKPSFFDMQFKGESPINYLERFGKKQVSLRYKINYKLKKIT